MKKPIVLIVVLVGIAVAIYFLSAGSDGSNLETETNITTQVSENADESERKEQNMEEQGLAPFNGLVGPSDWISENVLSTYDPTAFELTMEQTGTKLAVLYFYADWCPSCKKEFPELLSAMGDLKDLPVLAFIVNFNDSLTDEFDESLAREHGVAYQHTKVFLVDGEKVLKSPETWSKSRYIKEINKVLN